MPVTKSGFKKAFMKTSNEVLNDLGQLTHLIEEVDAMGGEAERFRPLLKKLQSDFDKVQSEGDESRGAYKKAVKNLKTIKGQLETTLRGIKAQKEFQQTTIQDNDLPELHFYSGSVPGLDKLPDKERAHIEREVVEKIKNGKHLFDRVMEDDFDPKLARRPTRKDLADFAWYMKSLAETKQNEPTAKGAITLPDPGNKLRKYFERTKGMYYRSSSHVVEQANRTDANPEGERTPRGVDYYDGKVSNIDNLLPYGMHTVFMQSIKTDGGEKLYLKMETESAKLSEHLPNKVLGGAILGKGTQEKSRWTHPADIGRSILHGKNLFFPEKDKTGLSAFREQTPHEDIEAFDDLIDDLKYLEDEHTLAIMTQGYKKKPTKKKKLAKEKKKGSNRIRVFQMVKNARQALEDDDVSEDVKESIQALLDDLLDKYPDADDRFGGEMVLDNTDLGRPVDDEGSEESDSDDEDDDSDDEDSEEDSSSEDSSSTYSSSSEEDEPTEEMKQARALTGQILDLITVDRIPTTSGQVIDEDAIEKDKRIARDIADEVIGSIAPPGVLLGILEDLVELVDENTQNQIKDMMGELDQLLSEM